MSNPDKLDKLGGLAPVITQPTEALTAAVELATAAPNYEEARVILLAALREFNASPVTRCLSGEP